MFDDRSPIYRQIADRIKADVLSETLKGDEQVMSTNQYAEPAADARGGAEGVPARAGVDVADHP